MSLRQLDGHNPAAEAFNPAEANTAIIDYLNPDCLYYLCQENPAVFSPFSKLSRLTRAIALRCFHQANQSMIRAVPSLFSTIDRTTITIDNAVLLFMRLINNLHDEAQRLNCDRPSPANATELSKMEWECAHYRDLVIELEAQIHRAKANDFNTFVIAVASQIEVVLPKGEDLRNFWENTLKHDPRIQQVTRLNLFDKNMKFLPPEISLLFNLDELNLGNNQLKDLPPELAFLSKLTTIKLNNNQLSKIPPVLTSLPNLQHIRLQGNKLTELPAQFASLQKLEYLDLSQNPLRKIPPEINALLSLNKLYLNGIEMAEMSNDLTTLPNLSELYLSSNQLKEVPWQTAASFPGLSKLYLIDNPLTENAIGILRDRINSKGARIDLQWERPQARRNWGDE